MISCQRVRVREATGLRTRQSSIYKGRNEDFKIVEGVGIFLSKMFYLDR